MGVVTIVDYLGIDATHLTMHSDGTTLDVSTVAGADEAHATIWPLSAVQAKAAEHMDSRRQEGGWASRVAIVRYSDAQCALAMELLHATPDAVFEELLEATQEIGDDPRAWELFASLRANSPGDALAMARAANQLARSSSRQKG